MSTQVAPQRVDAPIHASVDVGAVVVSLTWEALLGEHERVSLEHTSRVCSS